MQKYWIYEDENGREVRCGDKGVAREATRRHSFCQRVGVMPMWEYTIYPVGTVTRRAIQVMAVDPGPVWRKYARRCPEVVIRSGCCE